VESRLCKYKYSTRLISLLDYVTNITTQGDKIYLLEFDDTMDLLNFINQFLYMCRRDDRSRHIILNATDERSLLISFRLEESEESEKA
jgi:hypothetical protein